MLSQPLEALVLRVAPDLGILEALRALGGERAALHKIHRALFIGHCAVTDLP